MAQVTEFFGFLTEVRYSVLRVLYQVAKLSGTDGE